MMVLSELNDADEETRRCRLPVRRAISRTTALRCSTPMMPSCIAQSSASSATPSVRTRDLRAARDGLSTEGQLDDARRFQAQEHGQPERQQQDGRAPVCEGRARLVLRAPGEHDGLVMVAHGDRERRARRKERLKLERLAVDLPRGIRWKWFERGTGCEEKMGAPRI